MNKNKKAFLLGEHVVNIIVAVLCILVLIYLGIQVYSLYLRSDQEKEKAKYSLEALSAKITNLFEDSSRQADSYNLINPKNWFLKSFNTTDRDSAKECYEKNCLCLCAENDCGELNERECVNFDKSVRVSNIEYEAVLDEDIAVYQNTIKITKVPMELKLNKTGEEILIMK